MYSVLSTSQPSSMVVMLMLMPYFTRRSWSVCALCGFLLVFLTLIFTSSGHIFALLLSFRGLFCNALTFKSTLIHFYPPLLQHYDALWVKTGFIRHCPFIPPCLISLIVILELNRFCQNFYQREYTSHILSYQMSCYPLTPLLALVFVPWWWSLLARRLFQCC